MAGQELRLLVCIDVLILARINWQQFQGNPADRSCLWMVA